MLGKLPQYENIEQYRRCSEIRISNKYLFDEIFLKLITNHVRSYEPDDFSFSDNNMSTTSVTSFPIMSSPLISVCCLA